MKDFFKNNKNQILLCTYVVVIAVIALNFTVFMNIFFEFITIMMPLFYAIGIAFVLNIPMCWIEKHIRKVIHDNNFFSRYVRAISIILTLVFAVIILYILVIIIVPRVASSLQLVFNNFETLLVQIIDSLNSIFSDLHIDFRLEELSFIQNLKNMEWGDIFNHVLNVLTNMADGVVSNTFAFVNSFFTWFLSFCLSIYLLAGKESFIFQIKKVLVSLFDRKICKYIFKIGKDADFIFTKFVGGQLVDCAIKGIMFYIIFLLLNYPLPELSAAIITVCNIIPVFGPIFAMVIIAILIFAYNPMQSFWFIIVFQVMSNLESQTIYPKIVGNSIGLPGIWVLLSIFILGDMWGVIGMIMAVPLTALVYAIFSDYIDHKLKKKNISVDDDIFSEVE